MDQNTKNQILNLIDKSQSILLLTHAKADCDGLGSMISMYLALQALGKEVVAATNDPAPEVLSFLPSMHIVQNSVASNNFVITLDITTTPLNKIKYKLSEDQMKVNIVVTPKSGHFKPEDVTFDREAGNFDLIITFDTANLEHLGPIYDQNAELFFKTPVINIDHHASNTDYGQINYVDVVSASTTEMMLQLLSEMETRYDKKFLNEDVATLLLAGLITDTGSFQHANTSPRAMEVAAQLLDLGARQQEIIKNIYKTKKLTTLKLWGAVLSKVETDPIYRLVWSSITKNDLAETGATPEESEGIIDDLLSNAPGAEIIMLFKYNSEDYVSVSMRSTTNSVDVGKISAEMGGGGHVRAAGFKLRDGTTLETMIQNTLKKVREYQANRLNIHPEMLQKGGEFVLPDLSLPSNEALKATPIQVSQPTQPKPAESVQYLDFNRPKAPESKPQPEAPTSISPAASTTPQQTPNNPTPAKTPANDPTLKDVKNQAPGRKSVEELKKDFVSKPTPQTSGGNSRRDRNAQPPRSEKPQIRSERTQEKPKFEAKPAPEEPKDASASFPPPLASVTPPPTQPATVEMQEDDHSQDIPPAPAE